MDKKFGVSWHVAVGEGFGFDITFQQSHLLYAFYNEVGVVIFKC